MASDSNGFWIDVDVVKVMQTEAAERSRPERLKEMITSMKQDGERGGRAGREERRSSRRRRRRSSEGGEQQEELRWRVHQLEKERLELTSSHNQELCSLQTQLTCLRSSVERGEAQRVELQYQLTVSQRDQQEETERAAELQQTLQELQKVLDFTRQAREEDQHALQQELEERDRLVLSLDSENQRVHLLLQEQQEALEEAERRRREQQEALEEAERRRREQQEALEEAERRRREQQEALEESERRRREQQEALEEAERRRREQQEALEEAERRRREQQEALEEAERRRREQQEVLEEAERRRRREEEEQRRQAEELKDLVEREERSRREKEVSDHRFRSLQVNMEAERAAHLQTCLHLQEEQHHLELMRSALREVERERRDGTERALQRLQEEHQQCRSDLSVALETERTVTSDLREKLEATLSSAHRQIQDLTEASERLQEENQSLRQLVSDQNQTVEEVRRLRQESSDWMMQIQGLKAELEKEREEREEEKEERKKERKKEEEERVKEREKEEEERVKERKKEEEEREEKEEEERKKEEEERMKEREKERKKEEMEMKKREEERMKERMKEKEEFQKMADHYEKDSEARLSFLHLLYQRLLAGCVLLHQPHGMLGSFTWAELCDVINEQVDQLTSDLRTAKEKIAHLQAACDKKSVCVRELQRRQECVAQLQSELQVCRAQCDSLRGHASSLTSDLSRLRGLLSRSRRESASFLSGCALLGGALRHALLRLQVLCQQKTLLSRRLAGREELEEEVRRLAGALGCEEEEEEGRRRAVRRWRRSMWAVLAVRRWRALSERTTVLLRLERGGAPSVSVCGGSTTAAQKDGAFSDWLHSKRLSSIILSSMGDLQGALARSGNSSSPSPPDVMSQARSALSRLLDHLLDQSEVASLCSPSSLTPPRPDTKALVSTLQQHFLLFSQRLHSAEVERRSLRLEVSNLKRGLQQEREDTCRTVPAQRFHSVCVELRQALSREQEAQTLIQEQTNQLQELQRRADATAAEQTDTRRQLSQSAQSLLECRQEVSRKERSLRILGKHLSGVQRDRKRLEDELRDAARRKECLISSMKAAESSYQQVRECLVQSRRSLSGQTRPLPLPREHLELSGAESIMGAPEVVACQTLLSSVTQLFLTCSSRMDWLEQEVAAHRGHVTALRGELQDVCLRDNLPYVPVRQAEFPDADACQPVPVSDWSKQLSVS